MRAAVATLYVLGALLTGAGVLLAYRRARRELRLLEDVARLHESHEEPDLTGLLDDAIVDDVDSVHAREARQETERDALEERLRSVGMEDQPIRLKNLRLPMEY